MDIQGFYTLAQKDKREMGGYYPEKINFFLEFVGQGKRILDVGCNDGYIASLLLKQNNEVHGIDIVESNLKTAKKRGVLARYHNIEAKSFPYMEDYFDAVILGDVIEHVFDTDKLLRDCRRILKRDGLLLLTTPNVASIGRRLMLFMGVSPYLEYSIELNTNGLPSVGHMRYYTVDTLREQLIYNKFRSIRITGDKVNIGFYIPFVARFVPYLAVNLLCAAKKQ